MSIDILSPALIFVSVLLFFLTRFFFILLLMQVGHVPPR